MFKHTLQKLTLGAAAAAMLSTAAMASGSHANILVGASSFEGGDSALTFGLGIDMIKGFESGVEAGVGLNVLYATPDNSYSTNVSAAADLLIGYNFDKKFDVPLAVKGGVGYGFGTLGDSVTMSGIQYTVAGEYDITKKLGVGVKYLNQDYEADLIVGTAPASTTNYLAYLFYNFKGK